MIFILRAISVALGVFLIYLAILGIVDYIHGAWDPHDRKYVVALLISGTALILLGAIFI